MIDSESRRGPFTDNSAKPFLAQASNSHATASARAGGNPILVVSSLKKTNFVLNSFVVCYCNGKPTLLVHCLY